MVDKISFGSTYRAYVTRADVQNKQYSHYALEEHLGKQQVPYDFKFIDIKRTPTYSNPFKTDNESQYVAGISDYAVARYDITADDEQDAGIEVILANNGIKFEKIDTKKLLTPEAIFQRIAETPKGYELAFIDSDKLEKLIETQDSNFAHAKEDYDNYYKDKTDFVLKSGDKINPQTLTIRYLDDNGQPDDLKRYVKTFGEESLNPNSIAFWQEQKGLKTDINMYYGLKDAGLKQIPVYLDKESFQNACTLGLI